jgi:hypothetical protein
VTSVVFCFRLCVFAFGQLHNGRVYRESARIRSWRQWFDAPTDQSRCPCNSTSFSPTRRPLAHQLHNAPKPLSQLQVREVNGAIEVFAATEPT